MSRELQIMTIFISMLYEKKNWPSYENVKTGHTFWSCDATDDVMNV